MVFCYDFGNSPNRNSNEPVKKGDYDNQLWSAAISLLSPSAVSICLLHRKQHFLIRNPFIQENFVWVGVGTHFIIWV